MAGKNLKLAPIGEMPWRHADEMPNKGFYWLLARCRDVLGDVGETSWDSILWLARGRSLCSLGVIESLKATSHHISDLPRHYPSSSKWERRGDVPRYVLGCVTGAHEDVQRYVLGGKWLIPPKTDILPVSDWWWCCMYMISCRDSPFEIVASTGKMVDLQRVGMLSLKVERTFPFP